MALLIQNVRGAFLLRSVWITLVTLVAAYAELAQAQTNPLRVTRQGKGEIVAVFITSSCCTAIVPQLRAGLDRMRERLAAQALAEGVGFRLVGVALEWSPDSGWAHLKRYGAFDEVTVGSNWLSLPIERLVWQDSVTTPSVPQVVIYRHSVDVGERSIQIGPPQIRQRVRGWKEIQDWGLSQQLIP